MSKVRVGVVGYGVVGKRVADAVALQDDMELVGIADVAANALVKVASEKKYPVFAAIPEATTGFENSGIKVAGRIEDLISQIDIVVDASPPGNPEKNLVKYEKAGVKAILEGGEKHELTGMSFNALANYEEAYGKDKVRVVSCNTTAECRVLSTINNAFGIEEAFLAITRRGADPVQIKSGPINATIPALPGFSHHAPDIVTVIPGLNVKSMAVKVSTTLMHVHIVQVRLTKLISRENIVDLFHRTPRILLITKNDNLPSSAHLLELARDRGRPRSDLWECAIWEESIVVENKTAYFMMGIHMESIIVPENVDCIRTMMEIEQDKWTSMYKTDVSMGFAKDKSCYG